MPRDPFEVEIGEYEGVDVARIASEELFAAAVRAQKEWRHNLRTGEGAAGSHGRAYEDTGEAINDITVSPAAPGALEYEVGGDVIQLVIAEYGRAPGSVPPFEPIAAWARRHGLRPEDGQSFDDMVNGIRFAIAERGLPGFAPAQLAAMEVDRDLQERVERRFQREFEQAQRGHQE